MSPLVYLQKSRLGYLLFELRGRELRVSSLMRRDKNEATFDIGAINPNYERFQRRFMEPVMPLLSLSVFTGWLGLKLLEWDLGWTLMAAIFPFEFAVVFFVMAMQCLGKIDFVLFRIRSDERSLRIARVPGMEADYERFVTELEARIRLIDEGRELGDWVDADNEEGLPKITAAAYRTEDRRVGSGFSLHWLIATLGGGMATGFALTAVQMPETVGGAFMFSFIGTMVGISFAVMSFRNNEGQRLLAILGLLLAVVPFAIFLANPPP